ncbi:MULTISPECIES: hypothetical protein [unclassified Mesorhizobium]|uniref:hypothetical protein n=1 Tax=unclassified Mesorhizobium TaxID=325217 RepID=UPI0011277000|nr:MULTISPECIES: hypothetical protein [unclassified Mesorhizobium]TPM06136.1 hypothetical protein FJ939_13630 [Mesorhizobium sp. B2-3-8]TPM13867.1 hypothetical protein FJ940_17770 [Mesorhizobium sp. B2-3-7]
MASGVHTDIITLMGKDVEVKVKSVDQMTLRFFSENPRIYSHLWQDDSIEPTQQQIFEVLSKAEHVRETLVPSIKANGGLIEPLLVRGVTVLEGNSRLAAYRLLAQVDAVKWKSVRIRQLPDDISEADIFSLLGEYHIVGKKDWLPFEQAGYVYRQHKKHGVQEEVLTGQIGLSRKKIRHLISVYQYMIDCDDRTPSRWSYYDELLKGRRFDSAMSAYPDFRKVIVEKIQSGEIERAVDVRDGLPLIIKAGGNTLKRFMSGALSFEKSVADARFRGAGNYNYRKLNDFRQWLVEGQLDDEFRSASDNEKRMMKFEIEKIERRLKGLLSLLEPPSATSSPPKRSGASRSK